MNELQQVLEASSPNRIVKPIPPPPPPAPPRQAKTAVPLDAAQRAEYGAAARARRLHGPQQAERGRESAATMLDAHRRAHRRLGGGRGTGVCDDSRRRH